MTGTPKPAQASGRLVAMELHRREPALAHPRPDDRPADSLTKTPTTAPSAGRVRASAAAIAGSTKRGERG